MNKPKNIPRLASLIAITGVVSLVGAHGMEGQQTEDRFRFNVDVQSVNLDVVVVDDKGRFVEGLTQEDFQVSENGHAQELSYFTATSTPVSTLLLLDSSSSVSSSLSAIQTAAYVFLQRMVPGDTARIATFNQGVRFGPAFSGTRGEHLRFLQVVRPGGRTALYDAIIAGLEELKSVEGRTALLLFSDGDDSGGPEGSKSTQEEALEHARLSGATIYTVGFHGWNEDRGTGTNKDFLEELALTSGGRAFFTEVEEPVYPRRRRHRPENEEEIQKRFIQIHQELHRQYHLAYPLVDGPKGGEWRTVDVSLPSFPRLVIRARQGYFAPEAKPDPKKE